MKNRRDWQQILIDCKINIQKNIKPCLNSLNGSQTNLGIGAGGDQMKPVDLASETAIVDCLLQHEISFTLISEESGIKEFGSTPKEYYVCVDPIDGTTNFIHGLPFYAPSIAIASGPTIDAVFAGMVADLSHDETYIVLKGKGAFRNEKKIHTSKTRILDEAVIGIDLNAYKSKLNLSFASQLIENIRHTRHFGANALEVCYVAAGLTDGFIDLRNKIRTTDVAASFLIAKEAGAIVTDAYDKPIDVPLDPKQTLNFIVSANIEIHRQVLNLVTGNV
jgi:myo-inositol-1(or 4)-monophosphatase